MSEQSILRLLVSASVNPKDWEKFKELMAEAKTIVPKEGPGVLIHECHYDPETFHCLFLESYANEKAFIDHAEVFTPLTDKYKVDWKINRIELLGNYSPEISALLTEMTGEAEVNQYKHVFKNK